MKSKLIITTTILVLILVAKINAQWLTSGNALTSSQFIGTVSGNTQDMKFKLNGTQRMLIQSATGNVGIGLSSANSKLHVYSNTSASLTGGGIFTVGSITSKNLVFDNDEIQARSNGSAGLLYLNRSNGNVWICNDATATASTPVMHVNSSYGNAAIGSTAISANRLYISGSSENSETVFRCKVNYSNTVHGTNIITKAISGFSTVETAFGVGVYGEGTYQGVSGYATGSGNSDHHGVYGEADGSGTGKHIGVYGTASGGSENYGGYFDTKVFANAIRIGDVGNEPETESAAYKLTVDGKIICEELRIMDSGNWPDYVFQEDYQLPTIDEVSAHIKDKGHLPGLPSACEIEENGISVGQSQKMMMEKIEELTLYIIQLKSELDLLKGE